MRTHPERSVREELESVARELRDEQRRPQSDVTPEPTAPLDEMDVAPLTDPEDVKGG